MSRNVYGMSQSDGKVFLNVYDLHEQNEMLYPLGLGMFHSGVQVGRLEYTFGRCFHIGDNMMYGFTMSATSYHCFSKCHRRTYFCFIT